MFRILRLVIGLTLGFISLFASAFTVPPWNLPRGVTPTSHEIYDLHMFAFYICVVIGVVVFSALIFTLLRFRRSRQAQAENFHEHLSIEILWTIIPFVLIVVLAIPASMVLFRIHDTRNPDLDIKITGYQWKWKYDYLDQGVHFFSSLSTPLDEINGSQPKDQWYLLEVDHPLVVPIHEKIRLLVTSNDVIHSWWVPSLGVKQDAVPGFINQNWMYIEKPGIYRGQCAELCGAYHGFMPIVVDAVTKAQFAQWVKKQNGKAQLVAASSDATLSKDELLKLGKEGYDKNCAVCHQVSGEGTPPAFPALKGSRIATGPVADHIKIVLNGKSGTAMQAFGGQLDDTTLAAIITYERNAWGNVALNEKVKQAVIVQPAEIKKARG